jgi:phosphoglycolate phosphatase
VTERWPEAVVFDLDGTLIDSVGDITDALNGALAKEGLETFSEAELRLMVGGGARVLIERALKARGLSEDAGLAQRLHASFMDIYKSASVARTTVYPHGRELLSELRRDGAKLAICTNKPQGITEDVLAKLELRQFFQAVVGATDALPRKPNPDMLLAALAALGAEPSEAVMIGDSSNDVGTARAAGVPVVAVSFGYTRTPAHELGADIVVDSLSEVIGAIRQLAAKRG